MHFQKWVVYSLLASFFVVLTPRQLWHDCDHNNLLKSVHETHLEQKDCFACDFELGIIDHTVPLFVKFQKNFYVNFNSSSESVFQKIKFSLYSHRGPPIS